METVGPHVPNRIFRDFSLLNVDFKCRKCPSARCVLAANAINSDTNIFNVCSVLLNDWLVSHTFTA
jgi:hypothetical protein